MTIPSPTACTASTCDSVPGSLRGSLEGLPRGLTAPPSTTDKDWWVDALHTTPLLVWFQGMFYTVSQRSSAFLWGPQVPNNTNLLYISFLPFLSCLTSPDLFQNFPNKLFKLSPLSQGSASRVTQAKSSFWSLYYDPEGRRLVCLKADTEHCLLHSSLGTVSSQDMHVWTVLCHVFKDLPSSQQLDE